MPLHCRQIVSRSERCSVAINYGGNYRGAFRGNCAAFNAHLRFLHDSWSASANIITQQELRAELASKGGLLENAFYCRAGGDLGWL
jgi:hypothetical protein